MGTCHPQRVGFLRRFGLKTGIDFAHIGLESGMVYKGTTVVYQRVRRFNSKEIRKKVQYEFEVCCSFNLSNDDIISVLCKHVMLRFVTISRSENGCGK